MPKKTWMESIIDAYGLNVIGAHTDNTDISSAVVLTPPASAKKLLVQTITQNARYTLDGTTPSGTVGFQMVAGDPPITIPIGAGGTITFIEEAATAELQYQWMY